MSKKFGRNPVFKNNVRLLRLQYDMSQEDFAIALGVAPVTSHSRNLSAMISGWERGEREPSLEMVCRICRRFGVTADWLMGLKPPVTSDFASNIFNLLTANERNLTELDHQHILAVIKAFTTQEGKCKNAGETNAFKTVYSN